MMNQRTKDLVLTAFLVAAGLGTMAVGQESLKDIVEQEGLSWLVGQGQWKTTTDDGQDIVATYEWAVKGHAIVSRLKIGEVSSQGMIYFAAQEQQVRQVTVDSRGRTINATWESNGGKAIEKTRIYDEYGDVWDVARVYSRVNDTTIHVTLHFLENGVMSDNPFWEGDFKKEKK
jgi:hypothetical protein